MNTLLFPPPALSPVSTASGWRIFSTQEPTAILFRGKMSICADGAPRAYHPDDASGLDRLLNAGTPGNWFGIVTDNGQPGGTPVIQGPNDPAPGYHVSQTALFDPTYRNTDPHRYVDAATTPYVALPSPTFQNFLPGSNGRLGDYCLVYNTQNERLSAGIFADLGPGDELGEGSIEMARRLGLNHDARAGGTASRKLLYVLFPGSGDGSMPSPQAMDHKGVALFHGWGGLPRLLSYSSLL